MSNIEALRKDLEDAGKSVKTLQEPTSSAASAVGTIKEAINEPATLSKKLGKVDQVVGNLQKVSKFLGLFPYIGPVMRKVATLFKEADGFAKELKKFCDDIDGKLKIPKAAVAKLEKPLSIAKKKLDAAQGQIASSIAIIDHIDQRYADGVPPALDAILGSVHDAASPVVASLASVETAIKPGLNAVKSAGDSANEALKPLKDATKMVADLQGYLGVIAGPLSTLHSLLRPFERLLKWLSVFMDKVNDAIEWALKQVHLDLDKLWKDLLRLVNPLSYLLAPLKSEVNGLVTSLKKIAAPTLGERLEALAQAAGDLERELQPLGSASTTSLLFAATSRRRPAKRRTRRRPAA